MRFGELTAIVLSSMKPSRRFKILIKSRREWRTFIKIRVCKLAPDFFDDLDVFKIY
jgi:hypothetical protein